MSHRRKLILLGALLTLALALSACANAAEPTATSAPAATDTPMSEPATPTPEPPTAEPTEEMAEPTQAPEAEATATSEPTPTTEPTAEPTPSVIEYSIVPEETTASYSIEETFIDQGNVLNTAIGRTNAVTGALSLDMANPANSQLGQIIVDISTLTSDQGRRDRAIRDRWLESAKFPQSTFTATEILNFPADPQVGQVITFQLVGDMLIKETTRPVTWDVTATLNEDGSLTGVAKTFIMLADFNIPIPNILNILSVTDGATVSLDFTLRPAQ